MQLLSRLLPVIVGLTAFVCVLKAEVSVVDNLGRKITLPSAPQRIVSIAPSITETLFALGAGGQVVGVTDFCNYPPEAATKSRVGGVTNPSLETIISLKPDLIIVSMEGNVREDFNKMVGIGCPVFVTNPRSLAGIQKSILDLGQLIGKADNATRLVQTIQQCEDSVKSLVKTTKGVLLIVSLQPLIVVGGKTFLSELLVLAGGRNVAGASPSTYPTLSREAVVEANPDVIIVMSDALANADELPKFFPEWVTLNAFRTRQVFRINSDIISRPGPRAIDGLVTLYGIINEGHE